MRENDVGLIPFHCVYKFVLAEKSKNSHESIMIFPVMYLENIAGLNMLFSLTMNVRSDIRTNISERILYGRIAFLPIYPGLTVMRGTSR